MFEVIARHNKYRGLEPILRNRRCLPSLTALIALAACLGTGCRSVAELLNQPAPQVEVAADVSGSNAESLPGEFTILNQILDMSLPGAPLVLGTYGARETKHYDGQPEDSSQLTPVERSVLRMPGEGASHIEIALNSFAKDRSGKTRVLILLSDGGFERLDAFTKSAEALSHCKNVKALIVIGVTPESRPTLEKVLGPRFGDRIIVASNADRGAVPERIRALLQR